MASTEPGFGELLRTYRITAGLSQEDLAARAGLSAHGISDLERGARTRPYAATVQRLVEALDLSEPDARRLHTVARALPSGQSKAAAQDGRTAKPSTLVGRASEYSILLEALTAATRGRGSLVTIAGDAGIGKTALCQQLADHAVTHNVVVLISHCFEVSLARPYTPFVEALHGYAAEADVRTLKAVLGDFAADLAHIVPELSRRLRIQPSERTGDPEEDRYRLQRAVAAALRAIATRQPLLLIVEDLHDADPGTVDLLIHLSRHLSRARLLVVVTYRDTELAPPHRSAAVLTELQRAPSFDHISLRGLTAAEVRHLLEQLLSRALSGSLTADVHSQTEGNPLFVREVARQLTSFDVLPAPGSIVPSLPSGLRDAIGKRLSTLTPGTRQVLSAAAIIGREFDIGLLVRVLAAEEASVTVGLEEATGAGFIEERKALAGVATYRFVHAYFRHVLSDQLAAPRRMQLHRDLARSLEAAHTSHLDDVATELAEHLSYSSDPVDVSAAIHFAEVAAREAMGMFAYDTAVSLFERAWELRKVLNADNSAEACDGLLALGEALVAAGQPRRAVDEVAPRALRIAENLGERRRAFEACALALNGLMSSAAASAQASAEYMDWAESAAGFAQPGTTQEAEAALSLAHARLARGRSDEGIQLLRKALALGRLHNHVPTMVRAAAYLMTGPPVREYATAEQLADEFTTWPVGGVPVRWRGMGLFFCGTIFNCRGDYQRGAELWRQVERLGEQTKASVLPLYAMIADNVRAQADGRLDDVLTLCDRLIQRAEELGSATWGRHLASLSLYWALVHLGRAGDFLVWWDETFRAGIRLSLPEGPQMLACCHALTGNADEARARAAQCLTPAVLARADGLNMSQLGHALTLALLVQDRPALQSLSTCLWPWRHLALTGNTHSSAGRLLGEAAIALGRPDEARPLFRHALEVCSRAGYRAEVALIELDLADLLLRSELVDRPKGLEYLERATIALKFMGMRHDLQRARLLEQSMAGPCVR